MVLFIMLWLPYNIIVIIAAFSGLNFIPHWLWSLSYWLCYLNSGRFWARTIVSHSKSYQLSTVSMNRNKLSIQLAMLYSTNNCGIFSLLQENFAFIDWKWAPWENILKIKLFREEVLQTFHKMLCKDAWRKIFDNIESSFNQAELREQNAINL